MPKMVTIAPESYRAMPWANGRGVTTEIARSPEGDSSFGWRVSVARVNEDGPFSELPGIDRILVVLEGSGIRLDVRGQSEGVVVAPLRPYSFSGDLETIGRLVDGPIRDFNVMTRRGVARARVMVVDRIGPAKLEVPGLALVYCASGAGTIASGLGSAVLGAGSTAIVSPTGGAITVEPAAERSVLLVVGIDVG